MTRRLSHVPHQRLPLLNQPLQHDKRRVHLVGTSWISACDGVLDIVAWFFSSSSFASTECEKWPTSEQHTEKLLAKVSLSDPHPSKQSLTSLSLGRVCSSGNLLCQLFCPRVVCCWHGKTLLLTPFNDGETSWEFLSTERETFSGADTTERIVRIVGGFWNQVLHSIFIRALSVAKNYFFISSIQPSRKNVSVAAAVKSETHNHASTLFITTQQFCFHTRLRTWHKDILNSKITTWTDLVPQQHDMGCVWSSYFSKMTASVKWLHYEFCKTDTYILLTET